MAYVDLFWYCYCAGRSCDDGLAIFPYSVYNLIRTVVHLVCCLEGKLKLTQEVIDKIQEAMLHTKMNGDVNWKDGDEIDVCLAGTFAGDKFISIINRTRSNTTKK